MLQVLCKALGNNSEENIKHDLCSHILKAQTDLSHVNSNFIYQDQYFKKKKKKCSVKGTYNKKNLI